MEKLNKIRQADRRLATELGRQPTMEEIAQAIGVTRERVRQIDTQEQRTLRDLPHRTLASTSAGAAAAAIT